MPNFEKPKQKQKGFVMRMGFNSKDSDTTFKEKDQANISSGPGKYSKHSLDNAIISGVVKIGKAFGKIRGSGNASPATSKPATTTKKPDFGAVKQNFLSNAGSVKPKTKKSPVSTPAPKPKAKTVKPAVKPIAAPKSKPVSIATPKPTASASIPSPKPTVAAAPAKAPKVKESKPNAKKADKSFSKMVKLRTKANIISGDDSMSDKKKQRKLGRLRKRYDRQAAKQKKSRPSIGDSYKVNL